MGKFLDEIHADELGRVWEGIEIVHKGCGGNGSCDYLSNYDDYYCDKCNASFLSDEFEEKEYADRFKSGDRIEFRVACMWNGGKKAIRVIKLVRVRSNGERYVTVGYGGYRHFEVEMHEIIRKVEVER